MKCLDVVFKVQTLGSNQWKSNQLRVSGKIGRKLTFKLLSVVSHFPITVDSIEQETGHEQVLFYLHYKNMFI